MSPGKERAIFERWPDWFRNVGDFRLSGMSDGFRCDDGWCGIIYKLFERLEPAVATLGDDGLPFEVLQVKEKFGDLRFYVNRSNDAIKAAIASACQLSLRTCEKCGNPSSLEEHTDEFSNTRCSSCKESAQGRLGSGQYLHGDGATYPWPAPVKHTSTMPPMILRKLRLLAALNLNSAELAFEIVRLAAPKEHEPWMVEILRLARLGSRNQVLQRIRELSECEICEAIDNYERELAACGEDLHKAVRVQRGFSAYLDTIEGTDHYDRALHMFVNSL